MFGNIQWNITPPLPPPHSARSPHSVPRSCIPGFIHSRLEAISLEEICDKTKNDITLQKVIPKMQNRREEINIKNKELKILLNLIPELTLTPDGIL